MRNTKFNIGDLIKGNVCTWCYYRVGVIVNIFLSTEGKEDEYRCHIKWLNVEEIPTSYEKERVLTLVSKVKY